MEFDLGILGLGLAREKKAYKKAVKDAERNQRAGGGGARRGAPPPQAKRVSANELAGFMKTAHQPRRIT